MRNTKKSTHPLTTSVALLSIALANIVPPFAGSTAMAEDIFEVPLEQLLQIDVTSVSKRKQKVSEAPAAIFVLTQEDIKRSGATSIPEALRMVPGLHVAQVNTSQWAITSRGFNAVYADKLLVLIDGRTIYNPISAGVFWDSHDTFIEDIARIEVIRGPGATLWGSNAVNGVINIITKNAGETQGTEIYTGGGIGERAMAGARYGGKSEDINYRVYAKGFDRGSNELEDGSSAFDSWQGGQVGFRTDTQVDRDDTFTFQGDISHNKAGVDRILHGVNPISASVDDRNYNTGANLVGRWNHTISPTSDTSTQIYYDYSNKDEGTFGFEIHTLDLDWQHRFQPLADHTLIWGANYRLVGDNFLNTESLSTDPEKDTVNLYTGFIQDEIALSESVRLVLGSKLEHNQFSGFEVEPNARTIWAINDKNSTWAAISRAARTPARFNIDGRIVVDSVPTEVGLPALITLNGNENYLSEYVVAYELGYRSEITEQFSLDTAVFYNYYTNQESDEPISEPIFVDGTNPYLEIPYQIQNGASAEAAGAEVVIDYRPYQWWRLIAGYSYIHINMTVDEDSLDTTFKGREKQSPANQVQARSLIDLPHNMQFDASLRYLDSVDTFDVDAYWETDLRLAWKPEERLELALVGQNLIHSEHLEFRTNLVNAETTEIQRAVYAKATYKF